jgi:hypothetical protein
VNTHMRVNKHLQNAHKAHPVPRRTHPPTHPPAHARACTHLHTQTNTGRNHGYCKWRFVVCDASKRVVEGLNMTTDAYEAVLSGVLPSGAVLRGLPGLREIDIRLHTIGGTLPGACVRACVCGAARACNNVVNRRLCKCVPFLGGGGGLP